MHRQRVSAQSPRWRVGHLKSAGPVHPLAHGVQDVEALDDENVSGGQGVHEEEDVAPVSAEYLPATQARGVQG